jgi:hypothetical protein
VNLTLYVAKLSTVLLGAAKEALICAATSSDNWPVTRNGGSFEKWPSISAVYDAITGDLGPYLKFTN